MQPLTNPANEKKPWADTAEVWAARLDSHRELVVGVWNSVLLFQKPWISVAAFTGLNGALWILTQSRIPTVSLAAVGLAGYIFLTETVELSLSKWATILDVAEPRQNLHDIADSLARGWYHLTCLPSILQAFKERNPTKYMPIISAVAMEVFLFGFLVPAHLVLRCLVYAACLAPALSFYGGIEMLLQLYYASVAVDEPPHPLKPGSIEPLSAPSLQHRRLKVPRPSLHSTLPSTPTATVSEQPDDTLTASKFSVDPEFDPWGLAAASQTRQNRAPDNNVVAKDDSKTAPAPVVVEADTNHLTVAEEEHESLSESEWEKDFEVSRSPSPASVQAAAH